MVAEILTFRVGIAEFRYEQSSDVIHFLYFQKYWLQTSWYFICYKRNHRSLNFDVSLPSQQCFWLLATVKLAIWVRFCYFVARELATIVLFQKKYRRTSICLVTLNFTTACPIAPATCEDIILNHFNFANTSNFSGEFACSVLQNCIYNMHCTRNCIKTFFILMSIDLLQFFDKIASLYMSMTSVVANCVDTRNHFERRLRCCDIFISIFLNSFEIICHDLVVW